MSVDNFVQRVAGALLCGFVSLVITVPVACGGLMIYSQHVYGDVDARGPASILGGMAIAGILAMMVVVLVMWLTRPRS
jgi:hypothetical protein